MILEMGLKKKTVNASLPPCRSSDEKIKSIVDNIFTIPVCWQLAQSSGCSLREAKHSALVILMRFRNFKTPSGFSPPTFSSHLHWTGRVRSLPTLFMWCVCYGTKGEPRWIIEGSHPPGNNLISQSRTLWRRAGHPFSHKGVYHQCPLNQLPARLILRPDPEPGGGPSMGVWRDS